jgi:uncharacterized membrane protein YbhN (UPF0104 family)
MHSAPQQVGQERTGGTAAPPGDESARPRWRTALRIAFGVLVLGLGARYVRRQDWGTILDELRRADLPLLVAAAASNVPLVWTKAWRLRRLLRPSLGAATPPVARLMDYFFASYAADNLLMSQAGVGVRVALLAPDGVPVLTGAALQGLEKLLEGLGLALLALPLLSLGAVVQSLEASLLRPLAIGLGITAAVGVVGALLLRRRPAWAERVAGAGSALRSPAGAIEVAALTLAGWVVELAMAMATLAALRMPASPSTAALVVVAVNVAALVPGLPSNLGTFEAAVVIALAATGVPKGHALGFALLYHALHTLPVTLLGLPGFRRALRLAADGRRRRRN